MAVFALDERDELVGAVGVVGFAFLAVESHIHGLSANDLRGRSNEGDQTGVAAYHGDEGHCVVEQVFCMESLELSHHVGVHAAGDLGVLDEFVGLGEAEVFLNLMACVEEFLFVAGLGGGDGAVDLSLDIGGQLVLERIEGTRHLVLVEVEGSEDLACVKQVIANLADGLHVALKLYAEFLCEYIYELDCRSSRASAKPPDVGVEDVDAVEDGHDRRCQSIAGCAVSVEVDGYLDVGFELGYDGCCARGAYEACHLLEGDDLCAEAFHFLGFFDEVFVGENLFGLLGLFAEEAREESGFGSFGRLRIDRVAYGSVGYAAELVDHLDGFLHIVDVVEGVEDTHHVEAVLDSFLIEAAEHIVGVGYVAKEVAAARQCRQQGFALHGL